MPCGTLDAFLSATVSLMMRRSAGGGWNDVPSSEETARGSAEAAAAGAGER